MEEHLQHLTLKLNRRGREPPHAEENTEAPRRVGPTTDGGRGRAKRDEEQSRHTPTTPTLIAAPIPPPSQPKTGLSTHPASLPKAKPPPTLRHHRTSIPLPPPTRDEEMMAALREVKRLPIPAVAERARQLEAAVNNAYRHMNYQESQRASAVAHAKERERLAAFRLQPLPREWKKGATGK